RRSKRSLTDGRSAAPVSAKTLRAAWRRSMSAVGRPPRHVTLRYVRNPAQAARIPVALVGTACFAVWLALPHLLSPFLPKDAKGARTYREELSVAYRQLARSDDPFTTWVLVAGAGVVVALAIVLAYHM